MASSQRQSLIPSIRSTRSIGGIDVIAAGLTEEMYHAFLYLSIDFVSNLKQSL